MQRQSFSVFLGIALLVGLGCQAARSPDERELATMKEDLKDLESQIAGNERVSSMSGEAPGGEIVDLREKRDELKTKIERLERKIERQKESQQDGG